MFADVDKGLKNFMKTVSENPNCITIGTLPGQADTLSTWNDILEKTQKQLEAYLEFKCMAFPRFYFSPKTSCLRFSPRLEMCRLYSRI